MRNCQECFEYPSRPSRGIIEAVGNFMTDLEGNSIMSVISSIIGVPLSFGDQGGRNGGCNGDAHGIKTYSVYTNVNVDHCMGTS